MNIAARKAHPVQRSEKEGSSHVVLAARYLGPLGRPYRAKSRPGATLLGSILFQFWKADADDEATDHYDHDQNCGRAANYQRERRQCQKYGVGKARDAGDKA